MEHLSKLFGTPGKVKLLRLFLFNPERIYDRDAVVAIARVTPETASKELAGLARAGIIVRKSYFKEVASPGTGAVRRRRTLGWVTNPKYPYMSALRNFMRTTLVVSEAEIKKRLANIGALKLVVLSGFLIGEDQHELDLLLVGERVSEQALKNAVRALEADYGREIRYAVLTTEEYQYRKRVRDKLVRDIMDFEHREILNRLSSVA